METEPHIDHQRKTKSKSKLRPITDLHYKVPLYIQSIIDVRNCVLVKEENLSKLELKSTVTLL